MTKQFVLNIRPTAQYAHSLTREVNYDYFSLHNIKMGNFVQLIIPFALMYNF
jgi:hypothetical protein